MRYVALLTRKVCVPVIRKFIQRRHGIAGRIVRIVGSRPGVLKYNRQCQPNVSLINSLYRVHDSEDVIIRGTRSSQGRDVFKVSLGGDFDNSEWRKDFRRDSRGRAGKEPCRFMVNLFIERSASFAD